MVTLEAPVLPAAAARDVLRRRLEALFAPEILGELCPGAKAPSVHMGFPANEPPFYVAVDELADEVSVEGAVSMGHPSVSFATHIWLFARHRDMRQAADTLLAYANVAIAAVIADATLDGSVDNAFPSISTAGTAVDSSNYFTAAAAVDVRCTVSSVCPARIREIVNGTNCKV